MFDKLKRWLGGTLVCNGCAKTFHIFSFGFGTGWCPDCYTPGYMKPELTEFDNSYWLNRLLVKLIGRV